MFKILFTGSALTFFGALIAAVGAIIAAVGVYKDSRENAAQNKLLSDKSSEIAKLNEKISNLVTGGDSYCTLVPTFPVGQPNVVLWEIVHHGEFAIYDVEVKIRDVTKELAQIKKETEKAAKNGPAPFISLHDTVKEIKVGTVAPPYITHKDSQVTAMASSMKIIYSSNLNPTEQVYDVEITTRNGLVKEWLTIKQVGQRRELTSENKLFFTGQPPRKIELYQ